MRVAAGGFTNLSRDHLDYHPTVEAYLAAKLRPVRAAGRPGGTAVIDVDHEHASGGRGARRRGLKLITVGRKGTDHPVADAPIDGFAQTRHGRACR